MAFSMRSSVLCSSASKRGSWQPQERAKALIVVRTAMTIMMGGSTSLKLHPMKGILPMALNVCSKTVRSTVLSLGSLSSCDSCTIPR